MTTPVHDEDETPPVFQLPPERVDEIRALLQELTARKPTGDRDTDELLTRSRRAVDDLLRDHDALVKANGEAGEALALWTGAIR
jgi:hypothetical protein